MGDTDTTDEDLDAIGLTPPEQKLWRALKTSEDCIFDPDGPKVDRTLRGDILGRMLRGEKIAGAIPPCLPRQIGIFGAVISGVLDLSDMDLEGHALTIEYSRFEACLDFTRASFSFLDFQFSQFEKGAILNDIKVRGDIWTDEVRCEKGFALLGANIGGQFSVTNAEFSNPESYAIDAGGAQIDGDVFLREVKIRGVAAFNDAKIGGQFFATNAEFFNPKGVAILAQGAQIDKGVFLGEAKVKGSTDFKSTKIGGQFLANSAEFSNPRGEAIDTQGAQIVEDVFLSEAKVSGCADFGGAKIGGQFSASNAEFSNPKGDAIHAQGTQIGDSVFLDKAKIIGCADFAGVKIGGQFLTKGLSLVNTSGIALNMEGAVVSDAIGLFDIQHPPVGVVNFTRANLGEIHIDLRSYPLGQLILDGTQYRNVNHKTVTGWLHKPVKPESNETRHVGFWSCYTPIRTALEKRHEKDGFSNEELSQETLRVMNVLNDSDNFEDRSPFAYRQFARVLDANGHESEARDVRVVAGHAYTNRMAENFSTWRAQLYRVWRFCLHHLIWYGVKPWRIFYVIAIWWALGTSVFLLKSNDMTPAKERFYLAQTDDEGGYITLTPDAVLPDGYPRYSAAIYALDVMLPVVDFAQETHWRPKNVQQKGWNWLRMFNRLYLALGWAFSTIAVLGFTGLISDKCED